MHRFGVKMFLFLFLIEMGSTSKRKKNDKIQTMDPRRVFLPRQFHMHPNMLPANIGKPFDSNLKPNQKLITPPKGPFAPTIKRPFPNPPMPKPSGTKDKLIFIAELILLTIITGAIIFLCWRCTSKRACLEIDSEMGSIDLKILHDAEIPNFDRQGPMNVSMETKY